MYKNTKIIINKKTLQAIFWYKIIMKCAGYKGYCSISKNEWFVLSTEIGFENWTSVYYDMFC